MAIDLITYEFLKRYVEGANMGTNANPRGKWNANEKYNTGDYVTYQNEVYIALEEHASVENNPPSINENQWQKIFGINDGVNENEVIEILNNNLNIKNGVGDNDKGENGLQQNSYWEPYGAGYGSINPKIHALPTGTVLSVTSSNAKTEIEAPAFTIDSGTSTRRLKPTGSYGITSTAMGEVTTALGDGAWAEGQGSIAQQNCSHAEGLETWAAGYASHTEGMGTYTESKASHAEGYQTEATGEASHVEGKYTYAFGNGAHAEGTGFGNATNQKNQAIGEGAHSEGKCTYAEGEGAHAEGRGKYATIDPTSATVGKIQAIGAGAHAEGYTNNTSYGMATGVGAHSEGYETKATAQGAHSEGQRTQATGTNSHTEGYGTQATGNYSHAEGQNTYAKGKGSHTEGRNTYTQLTLDGTTYTGQYAHAEGAETKAGGSSSHAEGSGTQAIGGNSHAEGKNTKAIGSETHAEGYLTQAIDYSAHAEGRGDSPNGPVIANGIGTHAEGYSTVAIGQGVHSEGFNTIARGNYSHAEGSNNIIGKVYEIEQVYASNAVTITSNTASSLARPQLQKLSSFNNLFGFDMIYMSYGTNLCTVTVPLKSTTAYTGYLQCKFGGSNLHIHHIALYKNTEEILAETDKLNPRGSYSRSTIYRRNDLVKYNNVYYRTLATEIQGITPSDDKKNWTTNPLTLTCNDYIDTSKLVLTFTFKLPDASSTSTQLIIHQFHNVYSNTIAAHASGLGNISKTDYQTVIGKYNDPNSSAPFVIGWGTNEAVRKNIMTVDTNGNINASNITISYNNKTYSMTDIIDALIALNALS